MGNIVSYLRWRGDLSLEQYPFNEVDNLVLSTLAYVNLTDVVPVQGQGTSVTICEAAEIYFEKHDDAELASLKSTFIAPPILLKDIAATNRFCNARLSEYVDVINEATQFAALTISLDDNTYYIAFRGTDTTIVGWREDFQMSFQTVPAQKMAVGYLEAVIPDHEQCFRIGGHSKGGNLAVYAAAQCKDNIKGQIMAVYDNDGPGFSSDVLTSTEYQSIQSKIIRIIPEFSVVGMLFEHNPPHKIIASSAVGIMQHDPMTWEISGDSFIAKDELTPRCRFLNQIFDTWIESADAPHRERFTKDFFDALGAGGATHMAQVANGGMNGFETVLTAFIKSDAKTKNVVGKFFQALAFNFRKINLLELIKSKVLLRNIGVALLGLFFLCVPEFALRVLGMEFFAVIFCFSSYKLIRYGIMWRKKQPVKLYRVILFPLAAIIALIFLTEATVLSVSESFILGALLVANAYMVFVRAVKGLKKGDRFWSFGAVSSIISLLLGIVSFVTMDSQMAGYITYVGLYLLATGISEIAVSIYNNIQNNDEQ